LRRRIFKAGNSLVVSLPQEDLEYLDLREGSSVSVELDRRDQRLVIAPLPERAEDAIEPIPSSSPLPAPAPSLAEFRYQRIVVKLGTSVLTAGTKRLSRPGMLDLARQIAFLHQAGVEVIVVTSGAMLAGSEKLGFPKPEKRMPFKQVLAAVGQGRLMHLYEQLFDIYDITVAQALLTREDMIDRQRYLNARDTLLTLLERKVVPLINENDVVAVDEIRVGDNDNISAMVANMVEADLLLMLTETEGLYTADPRRDENAQLIREVAVIDERIWALAGGTSTGLGTGGMLTKLQAAQLATRSGTKVVIARGDMENVILRVVAGEALGTAFAPATSRMESRKRWILAEGASVGSIRVDAGAARALLEQGRSLLAVGIVAVEGDFGRGDTVRILGPDGVEIARGLARYGAKDLALIRGKRSEEIEAILGYGYGAEVVHRNDLVVLQVAK